MCVVYCFNSALSVQ